jgi:hypothetical protein
VLPGVCDAIEKGITTTFSGASLRSLREVVMAMTKRTPEFVKRYDEEKIGREVVEGKLVD